MSRGQQTQYSPTIIPAVKAAAFFGATVDEIANYIGVSTSCFYKWRLNEPELEEAVKRGREKSNERVVESLYQLAIGWKGGKPDLGAICFFLKNRDPANWRDVQHLDQAVGRYIIADRPMSEEEWIAARADAAKPVATALLPSDNDTAKPLE
jgi:hypothetical protein